MNDGCLKPRILENSKRASARFVVLGDCPCPDPASRHGARIITSSANHAMDGFSTFPFAVFNPELIGECGQASGNRRDSVIGNHVWLGFESVVMPGVRIGTGVIVAARTVVTSDVPDYAIIAGNPSRIIRMRFSPDTVRRLMEFAWWDWNVEKIGRIADAITGADIDTLERAV